MSLAAFTAVLDAVRGVEWPARRRVKSAVPGPHISRVRGTTAEFVEHRTYRQGDEPKCIDWKLVARTDRVFIRLSQERAVQPTMLVVDASASMAFPPPACDKWEHARQLAVGLANVARHRGDPVGLLVARGAAPRVVEPRTRRTVLEEMAAELEGLPGTGAGAPLLPPMKEAMRLSRRIVVFSDFLGEDEPDLLAAARGFVAGGHEVYAVHVVSREELEPDARKLLLEDPEQSTLRRPMSPPVRAQYIKRFAAWRDQLAREWRKAGAIYTMVVPGAESVRATIRRITSPPGGPPVGR
jgi:uncharacterized protein (DUF58 family)